MEIENLKKVVWRLQSFVGNLQINSEDKVYQICHEQQKDYDFLIICHKAKQEVEQLALHEKKIILNSYWNKFKVLFEQLDYWQKKKLREASKMNEVNIALISIYEVVNDLYKFYREFYFVEEHEAQDFTNRFRMNSVEHLDIQENDFEAQNQTMFAISKKKAKFRLKNGQVQHHYHTTIGTFDLENDNVYDIETGKIVQVGTRTDYNSSFMIDLANLYVLDVKDYLQHHYNHSINKNQYLDYVRYAVPNTSIIKSEGIKQAARDWLERLNIQEGSVKREGANRQKDFGLSDLITHENSFEMVKAIKVKYKHIGGKRLKLLLKALQELNLLPKDRVAKKFHECCKKEFDWNIKSYTAMNDYDFNRITDNEEVETMKNFIQEYIQ